MAHVSPNNSDNVVLQYGSDEEESKHDNSDGEQENIDMDQGIDVDADQGQMVAHVEEEPTIRGEPAIEIRQPVSSISPELNNAHNENIFKVMRMKKYNKYVYAVRTSSGEIVAFKNMKVAQDYANQLQ
ncbi:Aste57867_6736 [Aphanomyces stellatus]|uniref:Aste57867_6736 protein n=1 Tax=Aphanomyces stellatus TaxID=120398 RepID=A0A485KFZ6_9STRA|nr:hypothetical protein As57867_006716 [Aphanomyces stellatus]VFT83703.1 Aste57867_6736 [Aphanomyces stellatus]